jgi:deoxyribodipyrimidine photolyase-related protein
MKLFFILGNQLFPLKYVNRFKKDHVFYMAEDYELCTSANTGQTEQRASFV